MDFSIWMQSPSDWSILFISALLIGISKTGIQGISMLAVPLMAINFGAKPSTGLILPILCMADLVAVLYYRRIAEWKYILKLLPSALAGFAVALLVDRLIPPEGFKRLMGGCLFVVLLIMFWSEWKGKDNKLSTYWWYGPAFGLHNNYDPYAGPVHTSFRYYRWHFRRGDGQETSGKGIPLLHNGSDLRIGVYVTDIVITNYTIAR